MNLTAKQAGRHLATIILFATVLSSPFPVLAIPFLTIEDAGTAETDVGSTQLTFTLTLSEPSLDPVTVEYHTQDFSAVGGSDYQTTNGVVTFISGETNQVIAITVFGDLLNEPDEVFWVFLENASNAVIADPRGDGTILNDDPLPVLMIGNSAVLEGNTISTNAVFSITLSAVSGQTVSADYFTTAVTATTGNDFDSAAASIEFSPGATNTTLAIAVHGDLLKEYDETFRVVLTNVVNAIGTNFGTGVIVDDDQSPSIAIENVTVLEGTGGSVNAAFPVNLSVPSGQPVSVNFATASGSATSGSDFTASSGTLLFPEGVTNQSLPVSIVADSAVETTETFTLTLSNPTNVTIARAEATATILDDEVRVLSFTNQGPISLEQANTAIPYPSPIELSGLVGTVVNVAATLSGVTHSYPDDIDVLLVGPGGQRVVLMSDCGLDGDVNNVTLTFSDGAATFLPDESQISSGMYKPSNFGLEPDLFVAPAPSGPYDSMMSVFNGFSPNGTWTLYVIDDLTGDTGFIARGWQLSLTLSNLVCCTGGNSDLSVTVSDSPDPINLTSNLVYTARIINNGPAGATSVTLTNILPTGMQFVSATTTHGSLNQNAGVITGSLGTLGLGVIATVTITAKANAFGTLTNSMVVATDKNDPSPANNLAITPTTISQLAPFITVSNAFVLEGDGGTTNLVFPVNLSRANNTAVSFNYTTDNGSATTNADYLAAAGTLTIPVGQTNATIVVAVRGDILVEPNETFQLLPSGPVGGLLTTAAATGTILNDDGVATKISDFVWNTIASPQFVGTPIPVTITARDLPGGVATSFKGPARVEGVVGNGPDTSIVIAEVDTSGQDAVEFANVSGYPVDISGWKITIYDWVSWPLPEFTVVLPAGSVCGADEVFVLWDNGTAPGAYPNFFAGFNAFWSNEPVTNEVAVLLQDADDRIVDFVCAFNAPASDIYQPLPVPIGFWSGPPIIANTNDTQTLQRIGNGDGNTSANWTTAAGSIGSLGGNMMLPFAGTRPVPVAPTIVSNFVNGVWTGAVTPLQSAVGMSLRARDLVDHRGTSNPFNVINSANLTVNVTTASPFAATGQVITFSLSVSNGGLSTATAVVLTNILPTGAGFVSASSSQGSSSQNGSLVTFQLGTLASGASATASVMASLNTGGTNINLARVVSNLPDPVVSDNEAQVSVFVNTPPLFPPPGDQIMNEGQFVIVTNMATDTDTPAAALVYSMLNGPSSASLSSSGVFTWQTSELDGPGTNLVRIRVLDSGIPSLSATQTFLIYVNEVNAAPQLVAVADRFIAEGSTLQIVNTATDSDLPPNILTFSKVSGPAAASITPAGLFSWTPTEADGPGNFTVTLRVQDNGSPMLSSTQSFNVVVGEVNLPPLLTPVMTKTVELGGSLSFTLTANDADFPTNTLTFSLVAGPAGVSVAANGAFAWTPNQPQFVGTNVITVRVADNGSPSLSHTQSFAVVVELPEGNLRISRISREPTQFRMRYSVEPGFRYVIESRNVLSSGDWQTSAIHTSALVRTAGVFRESVTGRMQRFYRLRNLTVPFQPPQITGLSVSNETFQLQFEGDAGRTYAVDYREALTSGQWQALTNIALPAIVTNRTYAEPFSRTVASKFFRVRKTVAAPVGQRFDRISIAGNMVQLHFTALPGLDYIVESRALPHTGNWTMLTNINVATEPAAVLAADTIIPAGQRFYRLRVPDYSVELSPIPEVLPEHISLRFNVEAGKVYTVQSRNSLSGGNWLNLKTVGPADADGEVEVTDNMVRLPQRYYRVKSP